ncbi:KTSC domain-containing protein [Georgenia satyanarayanai]|uniref:KTSC domain-containing protein n=1 Tax=Georgenia satyanarayanai TaxID=860221 RepID=UPI0012656545|nr:KTSC domain-containing protein [Georgenia satyanarayanai]
MIDWQPVTGSSRIIAEAYLQETETILVRFPDGVEWAYQACPPTVWQEFTADSRGKYIATVLDSKPNGRWTG